MASLDGDHTPRDTPRHDPKRGAGFNVGHESVPIGTPPRGPKRRKDDRPTITLKHPAFTAEFRTLLNKAAERCGQTQADWIADTLRREAQRILKGNPPDNPQDTPKPLALATERLDEQDRRIAELAEQLRQISVRLAEPAPQRGLLARLLRGTV